MKDVATKLSNHLIACDLKHHHDRFEDDSASTSPKLHEDSRLKVLVDGLRELEGIEADQHDLDTSAARAIGFMWSRSMRPKAKHELVTYGMV